MDQMRTAYVSVRDKEGCQGKVKEISLAQGKVQSTRCGWVVDQETSYGNSINQVLLKDSSSNQSFNFDLRSR